MKHALILLLSLVASFVSAQSLAPYLQTPTPTSLWVSWSTNSGTQSTVEYGLTPDNLDQTTNGSNQVFEAGYNYHSVQLTGLTADTFYHYRVITGAESSPVYRFRTPPPYGTNTGHIRFLVLGDHQIRAETRYQTLVARAKTKIEDLYGVPIEEAINAVLNVGDQVDVGTLDHYRNLHFAQSSLISRNLPIMTSIGNHETYSDPGLANYKAHFRYENTAYGGIANPSPGAEEYYSWQIGNVVVVHLNTESYATGATQTNWVQANVNQAKSDPNVDWMISVGHRPYQAEQYVGDISSWARNTVVPIFGQTEKYALFIGGHHHLYARGQVRDYPMYHMISGGTAWDQYWGQSNEVDFDDNQKTIANWTWQIIDIDLAARKMEVQCFSEAHPRLGFVYEHKKVDDFHRQFELAAPAKPSITNPPSGPIDLTTGPYTFTSSPFATTSGESLNSVQFQISTDPTFSTTGFDLIRDVENIYGDTGAPDYLPTDINQGVNILEHKTSGSSLSTGTHHIRVRHRDTNVLWSEWSAPIQFEVIGGGSGTPEILLSKRVFAPGGNVSVTWNDGPGNAQDWIGIYHKGDTPGPVAAITWAYTPQSSGTRNFTLPQEPGNEYFAAFFENNGYTEIATRVPFYVGPIPTLSSDKPVYAEAENAVLSWTGAQGNPTDTIRVYQVGKTPGIDPPAASTTTGTASGNSIFSSLPPGFYFANYFVNGGTFAVADEIRFSIGDESATVSLPKTSFNRGEDIPVSFADGPGIPKDYMGIFTIGAEPGVTILTAYAYFGGLTTGVATFTEEIPPGDYFVAMYTNDSYTQVSNGVEFTVVDQTNHTSSNAGFDNASGNLASDWNESGGSIRGGANGGFGWTGGYFVGGSQPTGNTFATTVDGPVRQDLADSFVAGRTYTLTVELFSAGNYADARNSSILWNLALTANGSVVTDDTWFSDEFGGQSVTNGGPIPDDHILTVTSGSNGLTTATLVFTADSSVAGQTIGIRLGGNSNVYGVGGGDDYYGMMDNVSLTSVTSPFVDFRILTGDFNTATGEVTLTWNSDPTPGTEYSVEESSDLGVADPWTDVPGEDQVPTGGSTTQRTFNSAGHGPRHFYRVGVN